MYYKSFLAKVLGSDYREIYGYEVINFIEKELEARGTKLNKYQKEALRDGWAGEYGRPPFNAFVWNEEKKRPGVLWRLSAIPLGVWLFLLIAFMPLKWLLTGKRYYAFDRNADGRQTIGGFTASWIDKVRG